LAGTRAVRMAIYLDFAILLDYPRQPILNSVNACVAELALDYPDAFPEIAAFQQAVATRTPGELQELYINAFDLRPDCTPNLGYHLFGDDGRRGLFLAELKGRMEANCIALGSELPDHISLVLRYIHQVESERDVVIQDCLLPAVSRMAEALNPTDNAYKHVLGALLSILHRQHDASATQVEALGA
jgi:nitrate reductase delta subunit